MTDKKNQKPVRRGNLSRLLNGENIKENNRKNSHFDDDLTICDKNIDGA